MQLGQKGKGSGKVRPNRPIKKKPKPAGAWAPGPVETTAPQFSGMPQFPPEAPNFLPNTPGFEAAQSNVNNQRLAGATQYSTGNQLVSAGSDLGLARLGTDRGYAARDVDEAMAERGLYDSGIRAQEQQRQVAIPYGRQEQDIGLDAMGQYSDLATGYGGSELDVNQQLFQAYLQRALDAQQAMPLGLPIGGYQLPNTPEFNPIYPAKGKPKGGKVRPKKRKK